VSIRRLRKEVEQLEEGRGGPKDEREREVLKRRIRETAEHMNDCARGGEPLFEITAEGDVLCANDGKPVTTWHQTGAEQFYWMEMEWSALHLVRGCEPYFTLDETGTFVSPDGRFALSRERMDLRGLMGPRTQEQQQEIPPERWRRFLEADEEAAELLERIRELTETSPVPDTYKEPGHEWHELGEINDRMGRHDLGSVFVDAVEREAVRRLTWTLTHKPDARTMLSELTRRRDAFVADEGSMPINLPLY